LASPDLELDQEHGGEFGRAAGGDIDTAPGLDSTSELACLARSADDLSYVLGLGLVRVERGELQISNPIYREVIPRALSCRSRSACTTRRSGTCAPTARSTCPSS
jgi:hypothetical protein